MIKQLTLTYSSFDSTIIRKSFEISQHYHFRDVSLVKMAKIDLVKIFEAMLSPKGITLNGKFPCLPTLLTKKPITSLTTIYIHTIIYT